MARPMQFMRRMSIATRFALGVSLLLLLILTVSITGYLSTELVREAQSSIQFSTEIQRLVLEMDRGVEKARRLHADFHLQYPEIGLAKAHELYAQPSARQISQAISLSKTLQQLMQQAKVDAPFRRIHVDLNLYLSSAKRFADTSIQSVELVTKLSAPENGLEAKLESQFAELASDVARIDGLVRLFAEMKAFAQDYRISRKRHLMQSAFNTAFMLRQESLHNPALGNPARERIGAVLDRITATAQEILEVDVAIKARFNDFALQAEAADKVSATLVKVATQEVDRARARIDRAHQIAIVIMAVITLMGLFAAVSIARSLNASITQRVVRLTRSAGELRKGNLEVFVAEEGEDELSQLARTLNVMTARIRELVEQLEQKVEQRTQELAASERRFRELFEHSTSGVAVFEKVDGERDFVLRDVNRAVERIEGAQRLDLLGKRSLDAFPGIQDSGLLDVLQQVWQTGRSAPYPEDFYSDGRVSGWREGSVYKLPSGEVVALYDDLTAQKEAETERRAMEAKLQRAQKMETIGLLAGGVAHDLNNILSGIIGYPELLMLQLPEDSSLRAPIRAIHESGQRAVAVVADLLTVARGVACVKVPADLNALVSEYLSTPENEKLRLLHGRISCTTDFDPFLHNIECSTVHIKKCIMNLVTNAMEAIDGSGTIVIATRNRTVDGRTAWENSIKPGKYSVLTVKDDGIGIPEKDLEHIFEPFYTKKVMGLSGTGLGLAVVWNTVVDHGGTVLVESGTQGTRFDLYFPASTRVVVVEKKGSGTDWLKGSGEKILVVDDEPQQRDIAGRMLKLLGYQVATAASGEDALAHIREDRADLVLLDMLMDPGINGRETYARMITIRPGQKAVIVSGFSESDDALQARELGARGFLKKPYSMEQLGRTIKEALNGERTPAGSERPGKNLSVCLRIRQGTP
ncbi:MAG: response regulator [Syntrophobacteraceae bacterium]